MLSERQDRRRYPAVTVLQRFSDTVGIVKAEEYSVISTYPIPDLVSVLAELPNHRGSLVEVATVPLNPGERFLLIRPANAQNPVWYCVCPMKAVRGE